MLDVGMYRLLQSCCNIEGATISCNIPMTGSGKGSGFLIAGNIKSSVLYDAQKLRRLQLKVGAQWARLARRRWGSCAGGEDPAQEVRIERGRLGSSAVGEDGAWAERRTHFRRPLNNH